MSDQEQPRTPEELDKEWLETIYQKDVRQLTLRSVLTGCLLGGIMSLSNLYVGLKSGWGLGVDIAAIILAFALWKGLSSVFPRLIKHEFNMMENTMMMTTAVAASWISSAGLVSAVPALTMVSGYVFVWWQLIIWIGSILLLGLFMAIPLKRQMITVERLRFPYNLSVVETLKAMHSKGGEAVKKAKALGLAGLVGVITATLRDGVGFLPALWDVPVTAGRVSFAKLTLSFEPGFIMMGIGALFGIKVGVSMLVGALLNYGVFAPMMINQQDVKHPAPTIRALHTPEFPLEMKAGQKLSFLLEEANDAAEFQYLIRIDTLSQSQMDTLSAVQIDSIGAFTKDAVSYQIMRCKYEAAKRIDTLTYVWTEARTYGDLKTFAADINAPALLDGAPNPLFADSLHLFDSLRVDPFLRLICKDSSQKLAIWTGDTDRNVAARLGFKADSSSAAAHMLLAARTAVFPLEMLPGEYLSVLRSNATSGASAIGVDTLTYTWVDTVNYASIEPLVKDLKAKKLPSGKPNPFGAALAVSDSFMVHSALNVRAPRQNKWEARLTLLESDTLGTNSQLGFRQGASRYEAIGGFRNIAAWSMWPGAGILVTAGLLALFFQYKTLGRTFVSLASAFRKKKSAASNDILEHIEIPGTWFILGFIGTGLLCVMTQILLFNIHWYMGVIAVLLTFFLAAVVARAGAEVGINPIGAMGKVTQLLFGVITPRGTPEQMLTTNLMTANVTAGAASSCSDTVGNLFVGYKVGAHPRKQFIAQMFGVLAGSLFAVPVYFILVPDANILGGAKFPAPAAIIWAGVARILSQGLNTLPYSARYAAAIAIVLGIIVVTLEKIFPKIRPYTPSCTAIGIALTIPAYNSIAMFLGSFIVWILEKKAPRANEMYTIPVASGLIAGESLTGVFIAALMAFGVLS